MIKNPEILAEFELAYEKGLNNSYEQRLEIFESMLQLKRQICPASNDPLEGLDEKIEIIRKLHNAKRAD
jgi:hypothetical protein